MMLRVGHLHVSVRRRAPLGGSVWEQVGTPNVCVTWRDRVRGWVQLNPFRAHWRRA